VSTRKLTRNRPGLTLIEVLVTLILIGLLAAIVFPVIIQQIEDAEPTKIANDAANIKTGAEVFHLNVRPAWPATLVDLAHAISTADSDIGGTEYRQSQVDRWNGPYIDASLDAGLSSVLPAVNAVLTGFGLYVQNQLVCYDPAANTFGTGVACSTGDFVALLIGDSSDPLKLTAGALPTEFTALDALVDGDDGHLAGKIRAAETGGTLLALSGAPEIYIVYLLAPYRGS
jgi:prepilin-type N-terminal cleavage/methylation domain-containing protein